VSDIQHENFELKIISDGRQRPSRLERTAVAGVLVNFFKQAGSRLTKQPATTKKEPIRPHPKKSWLLHRGLYHSFGMNRTEAAAYIGVSPSKFDEMVKDGRMPQPKRIDGRCVWHIRQLDLAFERLPGGADDDRNEWDEAFQGPAEKRHGSH
jgi:hypothetical protein